MSEMSLGLSQAELPETKPEVRRYFFDVSPTKLIVMSLVTLQFYQVYWFYKNWELARKRGQDVTPWARAIFSIFYAYPLFKEVRSVGRSASVTAASNAGGLAFLFIVLQAAWRLPAPYSLIGLLTFVPLAVIQVDIASIHTALGLDPDVNSDYSWQNVLAILFGGALAFLAIAGIWFSGTGQLPDR
jgi:hypothetical protein